MKKEVIISPSLLSADFSSLKKSIDCLEKSGAKWLHFDVMDGHFVSNISFGIPVLKSINSFSSIFKDVHLMISDPTKYVKDFVLAGANLITFHFEAMKSKSDIISLIDYIHSLNCQVGISLKPNTNIGVLDEFLDKLDLVLVMSVEPGFGGQKFIEESLDKIKYLDNIKKENNYHFLIEVDGGINSKTGELAVKFGADVLVAGSYIFKGDIAKNIKSLM